MEWAARREAELRAAIKTPADPMPLRSLLRWYLERYTGGPQIWYVTAESEATPFDCTLLDSPKGERPVMQPGRQIEVSCQRATATGATPDPSALTSPDYWELRSLITSLSLSSTDKVDVDLFSEEVRIKGASLIDAASCQERRSCEREKEIAVKERRLTRGGQSGLTLLALAGFGAGMFLFLIARLLSKASPGRIAQALSLFLVLGVLTASAIIYFKLNGTRDEFALWGLGLIWFGLIIAALPTLVVTARVRAPRLQEQLVAARRLH